MIHSSPDFGRSILIFVPTFNERENAARMFEELGALPIKADLLFLDDNSPDGTGEILDELARENPRLTVIHRGGKLGIGSAHQQGIAAAYERGYDTLITLDCDFTHSPADVLRLLQHSAGAAVTLGSRYAHPRGLAGWNPLRKLLTRFGHFLTRRLLGMRFDATGALRVYDLRRIPRSLFELTTASGYAFFFESLFILTFNGMSVTELPIVLPPRTYGHSKMSFREAMRSGIQVFTLFMARISAPARFRVGRQPDRIDPGLVDPQGWDAYWLKKQRASHVIYELIAAIYRQKVLKPRLTGFIRKHFKRGDRLLHAGCGSGQVDMDFSSTMRLTALDISIPALNLYARNNPAAEKIIHGSILALPFGPGSFDGIYNLGVLEHFLLPELRAIFAEFHRVLRPGGKLLVFWPHQHASSVYVLSAAHWVLNSLLGRQVQLHPPEVSLLRSRSWVDRMLSSSGFKMIDFYFGSRDGFIQAVVVCRRESHVES